MLIHATNIESIIKKNEHDLEYLQIKSRIYLVVLAKKMSYLKIDLKNNSEQSVVCDTQ